MYNKIHKSWLFVAFIVLLLFLTACAGTSSLLPSLQATQTPKKGITPNKTSKPMPTSTPWPTPWGPPAKVIASMPASIPCVIWKEIGCTWVITVTFRTENDIGITIERIRSIYVSSKGFHYTWGGGSGWSTVNIKISPHSGEEYSDKLSLVTPDLKDGRVELIYEGHDDNGNPFSGILNATLASP